MKQFKLLLAAGAMMIASGMQAQTNLVSGWDGGSSTDVPTTFGWASSNSSRSWGALNGGGARFTNSYSGYKLEDGTTYSYDANSELSSKILWIRYGSTSETYTYTFTGLEAGKDYKFSGLVGWHNNSSNPTFIVKVIGSSGVELGTWSKNITAKQTLSQAEINFEVPFEETSTSYMLQFTSNTAGDCMEALSAFNLVEVENEAKLAKYQAKHAKAVATATYFLNNSDYESVTGETRTNLQTIASAAASEETASAYYYLTKDIYNAIAPFQAAVENVNLVGGYLTNADFSQGDLATVGICTYDKDKGANGTDYAQLVPVEGWDIPENGDARAGGLVAFGSGVWIGGVGYNCPSTNADGETIGNILGLVSVWTATTRYTQDITLAAGQYTLILGVYNSVGGTTAVAKNLIGFVEENGTEHYATTTQYTVNNWTFEFITFTLSETTSGKISLGYVAADVGSSGMPHLFLSGIELWNGEVNAEEYEAAKAAKIAKAAYEIALAEAQETLEHSEYSNVNGVERANLLSLVNADEPSTAEGYQTAISELNTASDAFKAAKAIYDLVEETTELAYADPEKKPVIDENSTAAGLTTDLRAYYESHALAEGVDGVDFTSFITNATDPDNNDGWTLTGKMNAPASNEPWTDANGINEHSYFDGGNWSGTAWTTTMKQTVSLPAGRYLLTAKGRAMVNTTLTMSAAGESVTFESVGSTGNIFDRGWGDASVEFEVAENVTNDVEILVTAKADPTHEWFSISDFRLVQLEAIELALADQNDYTELNGLISQAEGLDWGFQAGQYAPYNNKPIADALDAAKAIDQTVDNAKSFVQNASVAISLSIEDAVANTQEVNAVYNGDFSSTIEGDWGLTGWTRTNNWGQQQTEISGDYATAYYNQPGSLKYGTNGLAYSMPLAANTSYQLTFRYRSHENNSNTGMTVSVLNSENEGLASTTFPANVSTTEWKEASVKFQTGAADNYVLTLGNGGNTWITGVEIYSYTLQTAEVTMSATNGYFATVTTFDTDFSQTDGLTAYIILADGVTNTSITYTEVESAPAGTAVLLYGNPGEKYVLHETIGETEDVSASVYLPGPHMVTDDEYGTIYAFNKNGKWGRVKAGVNVPANKGYIVIASSGDAEINGYLPGQEPIVDAINGIASETAAPEAIYNLQGQKVNAPVKGGIYIINGKKTLVK